MLWGTFFILLACAGVYIPAYLLMLWERERKYPNQHPSWLAYAGIVMCLIVVFFLMNQPEGYMDAGPEMYFNIASRMSPDVAAAVRAGDVLGSGTCGNGGCLAELWGRRGEQAPPPLRPGDVVEMTVEGIGTIRNRVVPGLDLLAPPTAQVNTAAGQWGQGGRVSPGPRRGWPWWARSSTRWCRAPRPSCVCDR